MNRSMICILIMVTTAEQEAALCLSLLMGYSVSMYANPEDEIKKQSYSEAFAKDYDKTYCSSPLKNRLHTIYDELLS